MKIINLTRGCKTYVSDRDYPKLRKFCWYLLPCRGYLYAARKTSRVRGKQSIRLMHWDILGTKFGDHRNHSTLDNMRSNLRHCTRSQNAMNQVRRADNTSGYKGVAWHHDKWQARIRIGARRLSLGHFPDPVVAALAYDRAAQRYFGEFAYLNFPESNKHKNKKYGKRNVWS